jgi:hypothetical protein
VTPDTLFTPLRFELSEISGIFSQFDTSRSRRKTQSPDVALIRAVTPACNSF